MFNDINEVRRRENEIHELTGPDAIFEALRLKYRRGPAMQRYRRREGVEVKSKETAVLIYILQVLQVYDNGRAGDGKSKKKLHFYCLSSY